MEKEAFSSQSLISIKSVRKGVIILKNGSLRSILNVSGINIALKSNEEQESIIVSWRNLLNYLDFPLEVVVHSRRVNIENYLNFIQEKINNESNELLKMQGDDYYAFIKGLVSENNIMKKKFYLVIPYDPVVLKAKNSVGQILDAFKNLFSLQRQAFSFDNPLNSQDFEQYYQQLMIRQNNTITNLSRIGLSAYPLTTKEIVELFYNLYNPETFERESLNIPEAFN
ncbi:MAG: hypothetical protein WC288_01885 [Candidatus Paceibacterota bacterium]|jgi:type IV secretory pathway VirB4 component